MALISTKPVRVSLEDNPEEWIEIKPKLGAADRAYVEDALLNVQLREGDKPDTQVCLGARRTALLRAAIVNWRQFDPDVKDYIEFKPALIDTKLDLDDPLVEKVLAEIQQRNPTLALRG